MDYRPVKYINTFPTQKKETLTKLIFVITKKDLRETIKSKSLGTWSAKVKDLVFFDANLTIASLNHDVCVFYIYRSPGQASIGFHYNINI